MILNTAATNVMENSVGEDSNLRPGSCRQFVHTYQRRTKATENRI